MSLSHGACKDEIASVVFCYLGPNWVHTGIRTSVFRDYKSSKQSLPNRLRIELNEVNHNYNRSIESLGDDFLHSLHFILWVTWLDFL